MNQGKPEQVKEDPNSMVHPDMAIVTGKKRHKPTKEVVRERRRMVLKYMLRGLSPKQIEYLLIKDFEHVNSITVENDIRACSIEIRKHATEIDIDAEVGKNLAQYDEIIREAWKQYHNAKMATQKAGILKIIMDAQSAREKLLERMGLLVPKVNVTVEAGDSWEDMVRKLRAERGIETESLQGSNGSDRLLPPGQDEEEIVPLSEMVIDADYREVADDVKMPPEHEQLLQEG